MVLQQLWIFNLKDFPSRFLLSVGVKYVGKSPGVYAEPNKIYRFYFLIGFIEKKSYKIFFIYILQII